MVMTQQNKMMPRLRYQELPEDERRRRWATDADITGAIARQLNSTRKRIGSMFKATA